MAGINPLGPQSMAQRPNRVERNINLQWATTLQQQQQQQAHQQQQQQSTAIAVALGFANREEKPQRVQ